MCYGLGLGLWVIGCSLWVRVGVGVEGVMGYRLGLGLGLELG